MPISWWLRRPVYTFFILRELTSVFVAGAALLVLALAWQVGQGPEAYASLLQRMAAWPVLASSALLLAALLFHAATWLVLAPRATALRVRGRRVPGKAVLLASWAGWAVLSGAIAWLLVAGG